jgi:hypothetical protein
LTDNGKVIYDNLESSIKWSHQSAFLIVLN